MRTHASYDAVVFDVGGTLLDVVRDPQEGAIEAIAHLGALSMADLAAGLERARAEWLAAGGAPHEEDLAETWINHYRRALEFARFDADIAAAARLMEESFLTDGWEVFPEVRGVLAQIRAQGFRMGVVSNWPPTLEATLEQAGLREYFDVVVASGTVGYAKPHPQIFLIAAERLGVAPRRTLHIGDRMDLDVEGAAAAGMDAVLLDRDGIRGSHARRLRSFSELVDVLSDVGPRRTF